MKCILCQFCKPEKDGTELGYVADVEHAPDGSVLTGWQRTKARIIEGFIVEPFCWVIRKLFWRP